jgi:hypothetical protein
MVQRMIRDGILPGQKVSGVFVIRRADFETWWHQQTGFGS